MGFRFRKSIKIFPGLKINFNKKSSSVTFGSKGAHYTISSSGKRTGTVGIPGTGISYTATSNSPKKSSAPTPNNNNVSIIKARHVIVIFVVLTLFMGFLSSKSSYENDNNVINSIQTTETESMPETTRPVEISTLFSTAALNVRKGPGTEYEIIGKLNPGDQVAVLSAEGNWSKIQFENDSAYVSSSYLSESYSAETVSKDDGPMVWISYSGKKYHSRQNCSGMKGASQVSIKQATQMGKSPCQKCY